MIFCYIIILCFSLQDSLVAGVRETFETLQAKSTLFGNKNPFPVQANRIAELAGQNLPLQEKIAEQANGVHPLVTARFMQLLQGFLAYKKTNGSPQEQALYASLNENSFIDRLLSKRPLMFMTEQDQFLLPGGAKGFGGFEHIGTARERAPLLLQDYLSYDEMQLSALIGISVPTLFVNDGSRSNRGVQGRKGSYQEEGILTGLVGARFEKPGLMEWQHMMVTPEQNKPQNGYGPEADPENPLTKKLLLWQIFYGIPFATFEQAVCDKTGRFLLIEKDLYLDTYLYKKRLQAVIEPFLLDANERGKEQEKKVYCHAVGLGLGVWQKSEKQAELMLRVYEEILSKRELPYVSDIDFSWFPSAYEQIGRSLSTGANHIALHYSKRNPADRLVGQDVNKLLVAMYAWDANAYPGNEYWAGAKYLTASGDPAAAACSTIGELQNPLINGNVSAHNLRKFE